MSPLCGVGSYPTFSPLPAEGGQLFSAALAVPEKFGTFPLGSTAPCVVPTFLRACSATTDRAADTGSKITKYFYFDLRLVFPFLLKQFANSTI